MIKTLTLEQFKEIYEVNFKAKKGDDTFLGAGGFGNVYKGWDKTKHEEIAIKKSKEDQNLVEEVERVLQIPRHKNIAYYETAIRVEAEPDDFEVSIMKYYPKGSLTSVLKHEKLNDEEKKDIIRGILEGLHFLHEELKDEHNKPMRLVHRDLKPQNILITISPQGRYIPLITDFGISKMVKMEDVVDSSYIQLSSEVGTICYKSPEQFTGQKVKTNLDLWAFGVILYQLMTEKLPFFSDSSTQSSFFNEVSKQITEVQIPETIHKIAEPYQAMIKACLVKDIKERVQKATDLLDILDGVAQKIDTAKQYFQEEKYQDSLNTYKEVLTLRPKHIEAKTGIEWCKTAIEKEKFDLLNATIVIPKPAPAWQEETQILPTAKAIVQEKIEKPKIKKPKSQNPEIEPTQPTIQKTVVPKWLIFTGVAGLLGIGFFVMKPSTKTVTTTTENTIVDSVMIKAEGLIAFQEAEKSLKSGVSSNIYMPNFKRAGHIVPKYYKDAAVLLREKASKFEKNDPLHIHFSQCADSLEKAYNP